MDKELATIEGGEVALFDELRLESLKLRKQVLALPNDLEHFAKASDPHLAQHRRFMMQLEAANKHLQNAIQVDDQAFRAQQHNDAMRVLAEKMAEAEAKLPPITKT